MFRFHVEYKGNKYANGWTFRSDEDQTIDDLLKDLKERLENAVENKNVVSWTVYPA